MRHMIFAGILMCSGVAVAGPHGGGGAVVREHGGGGAVVRGGGGVVVRDHYGGGGAVVRGGGGVVVRGGGGPVVRGGPIHAVGGRYVFPGGAVRVVGTPVIRGHYYNYYARPALIVENYDPVPGYTWVRGNWRWNGVEWLWVPGYFSVGATVVVD